MSYRDCLIALALWGVWTAYWIVSARGNKPLEARESSTSRSVQTVVISTGGLLVLIPRIGLPVFDSTLFAPWPVTGIVLMLMGLMFTVWARVSLGRNWSAEVSLRQGHELVRAGPYRLVRHPIYTGGLLAALGTVMMGGQWRGVIGFALILATLLYKLRLEESWLSGFFGEAYARYRAEVPALVPRSLRL